MSKLIDPATTERLDFLTAAAVDHAVRMQASCGTESAMRYLRRSCVPSSIADRVLAILANRRKHINT